MLPELPMNYNCDDEGVQVKDFDSIFKDVPERKDMNELFSDLNAGGE